MRYYLDTNILVYMLKQERDEISEDVWGLFSDNSNLLLTSTVCVHELIHLFQIGKVSMRVNDKAANIKNFSDWLEGMGIDIAPVTVKNLQQLAELPIEGNHRDPNDRLIIAQAISDAYRS